MKHLRLLILIIIGLLQFNYGLAYDFEVDGMYYNILTNNTVEVTYKTDSFNSYSGNIVIPKTITYGNVTYNITTIGYGAFLGCSDITTISVPNNIELIGDRAFYGCSNLTIINIPNRVTSIGDLAFYNCSSLLSISIPNSVTSIGGGAFVNTGWYNNQNDGLLYLDNWLLDYKGKSPSGELIITEGTKGIANHTFDSYKFLTAISIPDGLLFIGNGAFSDCYRITSITIPNSVIRIGDYAFSGCDKLMSVVSKISDPFSIATNVFQNIAPHAYLQVPIGTKSKYEIFSGWTINFSYIQEDDFPATYTLSITASGNGSASYGGTNVRNKTQSFTLNEGSTATITFNPDNGNSVSSVKVNGNDVTSQISGNRYTINNITTDTTLEVSFQEDVNALTVDGLNYTVTSQSNKTVTFTGGDFGLVLTVPATITQNGTTWKVTGIDKDALKNNTELSAVIWNPEAAFTATVSNPNLLLYVKSVQYAPSTINNVVVNGTANSITLVDAASGNNFYCPQAFTAQSISYTHHYSMMTGIGESRGWETIALPFDVQTVTHASKGTIVPFAKWSSGDASKPFWLYELKSNGFVEASGIKANTPYIISMPNNPQYADQYQLVGNVMFSAENTIVKVSDNLQQPKYNDRTFIPNFLVQPSNLGYYALNVSNDYFANNSGMTDGSRFVLNMRKILPFEAYMTSSSSNAPESIGIFDDMTTEIQEIPNDMLNTGNSVYDLQGRKIEKTRLTKGVYIVNGQKVIIR